MARSVCIRSLTALTATILAVLLFAMGTTAQVRDFPNIHLPAPARGSAALGALAAHLPQIAASYGKSTDELAGIFLQDHTLWADTHGRLLYACEFGTLPSNAPAAENAGTIAEAPLPYSQTFLLHSRPSATRVIYLDFDGQVTSGTSWNTVYKSGQDIVSAPFDLDGNPSSFNNAEMDEIQYIWQRVAEDYAPFDVDVTTQDPGVDGLGVNGAGDVYYGMRVVISPTNWYSTGAGGVAYVGVFNYANNLNYSPAWVFTQQLGPNDEKDIAEAASHEVGHTLGLSHDGVIGGTAYYAGQGNWAPIMGVGYYKNVVQWSKGEYANANNTEDDLAVMLNHGISYRADDHGNFISTATPLTGPAISASGVIETRTDVDMFSFQTGAGTISFTVNPAPRGPNLDISVVLYDGTGNLVASNDGTGLPASLTATVATGTYYLAIDGVGSGDPVTTGYSDYDSLGQYQITGTVIANGNQKPVATASASPTSGIAPLTVTFSSAGSSDPDGTIQTYYWDFNDGTNSSLANPSHTYNIAGTYTATLVVTDNQGLSSSKTVAITVIAANQAPVARAAATPASGVAPLLVSFSSAGSSDPDGSIQSYSWLFGDGTTSTLANPSHTYSTKGNYTATLVVTDNGGLSSPAATVAITATNQPPVARATATPISGVAPLAVSFSSAGSSDPDGSIQSYSWAFGDGTTSTLSNLSHTYSTKGNYTATLVVKDNDGLSSSAATVAITVTNQAPVASAAATPTSGVAPLVVSFSSTGSSDSDGSIQSYSWAFGDGTTSTSSNPSHSYSTKGNYTATLVVTDNGGLSSPAASVAITVNAPNQAPVASAAATPTSGVAPLLVSFSSAGSSDSDGSIVSYGWAFGDGITSTLQNPSHSYSSKGNYTATLVVTDNGGLSSSAAAVAITVNAPNQAPVAKATATPASGYAPLAVSFSSAGTYDPDGTITSYAWAFGDGTTSTLSNPSHTYSFPGTYVAVLTVTDNQGAQGTSSVTIGAQQDPAKVPDLIVSSVGASVSSAAAGAGITVTDTTKNQGTGQAAPSTTSVYFSLDAILDPGDMLIGTRSIGVLGSLSSVAGSTVVTIPANAAPGTRYLIVVADGGNTVGESNETNNTRTKSITVTGPDLYVSALSAPTSALAGSAITVKDTTKNQGLAPAAASTTSYYLSIDSIYATTDTPLGSRGIVTLLSGTSNTGSATVTIPAGTPAGTYYIIARADSGDGVLETIETNNTRAYKIAVK